MQDTIHHKQLRSALVETLKQKGITDENVLQAISKVPRHLFVDIPVSLKQLYEDAPVAIGEGQTISQPFTVAVQTSLLDIHPMEKILEIGTGSGYQAAVLFEAGAQVFTIERQEKLYKTTKRRLHKLGYSAINMVFGDGTYGITEYAPYDKIIVTAGANEIPHNLLNQLKTGGVMVIPVAEKMLRITKLENDLQIEEHGNFRFVPFLPGTIQESGKNN